MNPLQFSKACARLKLHEKYHMNYGGCGLFATKAISLLRGHNLRTVSFFDGGTAHIVVHDPVRKILFDSEGILHHGDLPRTIKWGRLQMEFEVLPGHMSEIFRIVRDPSLWNKTFSRSVWPKIEQMLEDIVRETHSQTRPVIPHKKVRVQTMITEISGFHKSVRPDG